jgi:hypothetical protein
MWVAAGKERRFEIQWFGERAIQCSSGLENQMSTPIPSPTRRVYAFNAAITLLFR